VLVTAGQTIVAAPPTRGYQSSNVTIAFRDVAELPSALVCHCAFRLTESRRTTGRVYLHRAELAPDGVFTVASPSLVNLQGGCCRTARCRSRLRVAVMVSTAVHAGLRMVCGKVVAPLVPSTKSRSNSYARRPEIESARGLRRWRRKSHMRLSGTCRL